MHVVIGAGLAGVPAIEAMRTAGDAGPITVVGDEGHLPYERPPLSKELLRGQIEPADTLIQPQTFFQEQGVTLVLGDRAATLDTNRRRVRLSSGREIGYARLLVATGSTPLELLAKGTSLGNDAVTRLHADHGVRIVSGVSADALLGVASVEAVRLRDGAILPCDLVVVAIGVRPATSWMRSSGIALDDGILVDELGRTNLPDIFAAGDAARTRLPDGRTLRGETYGRAHGQGLAVGRTMAGEPTPYTAVPAASSEQYGVRLHLIGTLEGTEHIVTRGDGRASTTFFLRGGRVVGALVMNRPRDVPFVRQLIERGEPADEALLRDGTRLAPA